MVIEAIILTMKSDNDSTDIEDARASYLDVETSNTSNASGY